MLHRVFGLSRGVMPLRMPVQSIVGRPIHVEKAVPNPTPEQIDELHQRYIDELRKVRNDNSSHLRYILLYSLFNKSF